MSENAGPICRRARRLPAIGWVLSLALALSGLSTVGHAAETLGPAHAAAVPEMLASVTILSDAAMAKEKGAGLQLPSILNDPTGRQRVLLWDELKAPPQQLAPATEPNVTGK